eukprot:3615956-Pyramimonas_sp.AAC.1
MRCLRWPKIRRGACQTGRRLWSRRWSWQRSASGGGGDGRRQRMAAARGGRTLVRDAGYGLRKSMDC